MVEISQGVGQPAAAEQLRGDVYAVLSRLLSHPPDEEILCKVSQFSGDRSELGHSANALARLASSLSPESIEREYDTLFVGVGRGELLPYASYYLTGFLNEKPLAQLREHLRALSVELSPEFKEPEDHIATLCEVMAGLIQGTLGSVFSLENQNAFFNTHLAPWAGHFFSDLEAATGAVFYAPVGKIGRAFMQIEAEAFRMAA